MAFKTSFIIYALLLAAVVRPQLSNGRLCANPKCSEKISVAITTLNYNSDHFTKLSFGPSAEAIVFAKDAKSGLWDVEINKKRGLVSPKFLKEMNIFAKELVPAEIDGEKENVADITSSTTESDSSTLNLKEISKTFEIIDGTTIYSVSDSENIAATATLKQPENTAKISLTINKEITYDTDKVNIPEESLTHLSSDENKESMTTNEPEKASIIENKEEILESEQNKTIKSNEENALINENKEEIKTENLVDSMETFNEPNKEEILESEQNKTIKKNEENPTINENKKEIKTENLVDSMETFNEPNKDEILASEYNENIKGNAVKEDASQTDKQIDTTPNSEGLENDKFDFEDNINLEKSKEKEYDETRNDQFKETKNKKQVDEEMTKGVDESLLITTKKQIDPDQEVHYTESSSSENVHFNKTSQKNFEVYPENVNEKNIENVESDNDITENEQERINDYSGEKLQSITEKLNQLSKQNFDRQSTSSPRESNSELPDSYTSYESSNFIDKNKPLNMITIGLPNQLLHPIDTSQDQDIESDSIDKEEYEITTEDDKYLQNENLAEALYEELSLYKDETLTEGQLFNKLIRDIGAEDDLAIESPYPPGQDPNNPGFFAGIANYIAHLVGFGSPDPPKIVEDDDNIELTPEKLREMYPRRTFQEKRLEQLLETLAKREAAEKAACEAGEGEPACPRRFQKYEGFNITDILYLYNIVFQYDTLFYLLISACTVLCFTLGYYFIENKKLDGSLIAKVNELEKALLIANKECTILKEDLNLNEEDKVVVGQRPFDPSDYGNELEKSLLARQELQDKNIQLEKDLEEATDNGLELNKLLNEYISTQSGSETISKTIEHLQDQLDIQREMIANLNASIEEKNIENKNLQLELNNSKKAGIASDKLLAKLRHNIDNLTKDKKKLLEDIDILKSHYSKDLENKLSENGNIKSLLSTKENEIKILQEYVRSYLRNNGKETAEKIEELIQAGEILATNQVLTSDRDSLKEQLGKEEETRKLLEDNLRLLSEDITKLKQNLEKAEREKQDSENRLEVLSNYFKEKESQLQKKIGIQEEVYLKKNIDASSYQEIIISLQQEVENYKLQNETLQKEIMDQERELKLQVTSLEKKYQDHWISARQNERKLEEYKQEAAQLRNRLTIVEKNIVNQTQDGNSSLNNRLDAVNGDMSASSLHLVPSPLSFPMPPGAFMAPPPFLPPPPPPPHGVPFMPAPPQFPGDRRPPPLGRMSSPPPPGYEHSPPTSPPIGPFSPIHHYNMRHVTPPPPPPPLGSPFDPYSRRPPASWEDQPPGLIHPKMSRGNTSRRRDVNLSSGNSSESNEKSSQHSGQV